MLSKTLSSAVFTAGYACAQNEFWGFENASPTPGSIQLYGDVSTISTLVQDITQVGIPNHIQKNPLTLDFNVDVRVAGIRMTLDQVQITEVSVGEASVAFVEDTNTIRTTISNANITALLDSELHLLPVACDIESMFLQNVTIQLDFATTSEDDVHWQIVEASVLALEDFEVTVKQDFWQKKMSKLKPEIRSVLDYALNFMEGVISGLISVFNEVLASQTADTFVFDVLGAQFNLTMTRYPEFDQAADAIHIHLDGRFVGDDQVPANTIWGDPMSIEQTESLWIHESTIDTFLSHISRSFEGAGFDEQIFMLLPELRMHYGLEATCAGALDLLDQVSANAIFSSVEQGLVLGDSTDGLRINLAISCASDASTEKELSVELDMGLHLIVNGSIDNFVASVQLEEPSFVGTLATSYIGDLFYHRWDAELTAVAVDLADDFNLRFAKDHDLTEGRPKLAWLKNILPSSTISPKVQDEFIIAGFDVKTPQ